MDDKKEDIWLDITVPKRLEGKVYRMLSKRRYQILLEDGLDISLWVRGAKKSELVVAAERRDT